MIEAGAPFFRGRAPIRDFERFADLEGVKPDTSIKVKFGKRGEYLLTPRSSDELALRWKERSKFR